ncbi:hypothetical protein GCM10025881_32710 [Pseudolysinimonas kribbensis]|uniref:Putative sensor domain-containing protein n=1 Tax=Pseudolysinimonas kribbensis TaxID=433641 RepID=A0ABQ6K711_9MICO|nr:hypothetical protein GCM10025881_32710 [Pseudolysinimonas kribbensis]
MTTTTETMSDMTTREGGGAMRRYGRLWSAVPRELLYLFIAFPLASVGFGVTLGLLNGGIGTIVTFFIGVILLIAGLYVARGFGTLELALLRFAGMPEIPRPDWRDPGPARGSSDGCARCSATGTTGCTCCGRRWSTSSCRRSRSR